MVREGTRFLRGSVPLKLERSSEKDILVSWQTTNEDGSVSQHQEVFNTVLFATGESGFFVFVSWKLKPRLQGIE